MYVILSILLFVIAFVVQTTVFPRIAIEGVKPDLILVITVYLGLVRGPAIGCANGFFAGVIEDVYSGLYLGSNALTKTIIGFVCGIFGKRLYTQSLFAHMLCVGLSTLIDVILIYSVNGFGPQWKQVLFYETVYNLICCPGIVFVFHQGEKWLGIQSQPPQF
jgi:rod shape-determining protein MreD